MLEMLNGLNVQKNELYGTKQNLSLDQLFILVFIDLKKIKIRTLLGKKSMLFSVENVN